jgi:hypothetical protein
MSKNLLNVVEEYLRSPEVQHRKNAVTAFAIMADEQASAMLVDIALTDTEPGVRQRAEEELLAVAPAQQKEVIETTKRRLDDPKKRQAAYLFLGRLRSNGWNVSLNRWPLLMWLRLTWGLNLHLYPVRNWRFRTRAWKYGLLGAAAGVAFMGMVFLRSWQLQDYGGFILYSFLLVILSPVIAAAATQRTTPIGLYADRLLGFVTEVLATFLFAFMCLGVVLIPYTVFISSIAPHDEDWLFLSPLIIPAFLAVVRIGTIFGYGRFVNRRWNWFAQIVMGVAIGTLALTTLNLIGWTLGMPESFMAGLWVLLVTTSFIAANAFAGIDNQTSPIRSVVGRLGTVACILILVPFIGIVGTVLVMGRAAYSDHSQRGPTLNTVFEKITGTPAPSPTPYPTPYGYYPPSPEPTPSPDATPSND